MMKIINLIKIINRHFTTIKTFSSSKPIMSFGKYEIISFKVIQLKNSNEKDNHLSTGFKNIISTIFTRLFSKCLYVCSSCENLETFGSHELYNRMIVKDKGNSWTMFFSESSDHILHVQAEELDFKYKLSEKLRIPENFKTPEILDVEIKKNLFFIKEEFVQSEKKVIDEQTLVEIIRQYENYYDKFAIQSSYFQYQHGDLFAENILFSKEDIYYIDWDWSGYYPYYFDIIFLIIYESLSGNVVLFEKYMEGLFDEEFCKLSKSCGENFDPQRKYYYLYSTLLYRNRMRKDKVRLFMRLEKKYLKLSLSEK